MEIVFKIAAVSICAAVFAAIVKKTEPAIALSLTICAAGIILYAALTPVKEVLDVLSEMSYEAGVSIPALNMVLKTLGISIVTKISSDICKESGLGAAASAVELAGSVTALYVTLPVLKTMLSMIKGLL